MDEQFTRDTSLAPSEVYIRLERGASIDHTPSPAPYNIPEPMVGPPDFDRRDRPPNNRRSPPPPRFGGRRRYSPPPPRRYSPSPPPMPPPPRRPMRRRGPPRSRGPPRGPPRNNGPPRRGPRRMRDESDEYFPRRRTGRKRRREYNPVQENLTRRNDIRNRNRRREENLNYTQIRNLCEQICTEMFSKTLELDPILRPKNYVSEVEVDFDNGQTRRFVGRDTKKSYSIELASKDAVVFVRNTIENKIMERVQYLCDNEMHDQMEDIAALSRSLKDCMEVTEGSERLRRMQRTAISFAPFSFRVVDRTTDPDIWEVEVRVGESFCFQVEAGKKLEAETKAVKRLLEEFKGNQRIRDHYNLR